MRTTIIYKGFVHYVSEVDPGGVTLKTVSGNSVHRHQIARSDPEEEPVRYIFTDWVTFTLPEFGEILRENGFTREDAKNLFDKVWDEKWKQ